MFLRATDRSRSYARDQSAGFGGGAFFALGGALMISGKGSTRRAVRSSPVVAPAVDAAKVEAVHRALLARWGSRVPRARDPLDGLILIILSQATSDVNCERAFESLKVAFPSWDQALEAPVNLVAEAIRSGGLANQKAARIQALLREIREQRGDLDLEFLRDLTSDEAAVWLGQFSGVGPKTVACVLVFFLGKPAFPVDTHVARVCARLGWIRPSASADEAHRVLGALVPDEWKLDLHVNFIAHGRSVCRARGSGGPLCDLCPIRSHCPWPLAHPEQIAQPAPARDSKTRTPDTKARTGEGSDPDFFVTIKSRHETSRS